MCGIFGYVGTKPCREMILNGLKALEYRGYDSAGIATVSKEKKVSFIKKKGKVSQLDDELIKLPESNTVGLGHTRWATHGFVCDTNAHPHVSGDFTLIHNGIVDNYLDLKEELLKGGVSFKTETDTEVILESLKKNYKLSSNMDDAICQTVKGLKGSFGLGILFAGDPDSLYIVRKKSPIIIGVGSGENFFASDLSALAPYTKRFLFLEDAQYAKLSRNAIELKDFSQKTIAPQIVELSDIHLSKSSKGSYEHYMLKEIHEQKELIASHIEKFYDLDAGSIRNLGAELSNLDLKKFNQVILIGCGSAYIAACAAQYTLEEHFRLPVSVCLSSEFSHKKTHLDEKTLLLAISQSGETADTLSSAVYAKDLGCSLIAICNTPYSSLTRLADFTMYIQAGTEVGVAATKTFTTTVLSLMTLSYFSGMKLGTASQESFDRLYQSLRDLPACLDEVLSNKSSYQQVAQNFSRFPNFLFMGRGHSYPIALEGALKLKEISYCHAEGYAGGELKHGPISLVTPDLPVVALCPTSSSTYKKMLSNMEEVAAREGKIISVSRKENSDLRSVCESHLECPEVEEPLVQAILSNIPLQFFAYYVALDLKRNIDQPRNLAKSVTVE